MCRPPAPDPGAVKVHSEVSPVLAQAFTEPFTVYSAKRFPGVPGEMKDVHQNFLISHTNADWVTLNHIDTDTTALSIAFGNQGQKLPLVSFSSLSWSPPSPPPLSPFPLLASTDQVPSTSYSTTCMTEKPPWDIQESEEGPQCLRWWFRRRFRLRIRGQRGYIRVFRGMVAFAAQIVMIGCFMEKICKNVFTSNGLIAHPPLIPLPARSPASRIPSLP